jgi:PAS domain S-box-containing protein
MNITERKHVEDKIREQEAELRQILDAAPLHLSVLRSDGSHLYINQSSLDFLDLTLEEWQNRDIRELVHPDDAERVVGERKQALLSGPPLGIEAQFLRFDGEYRWLFLRYKPPKDQLGTL